MGVLACNRFCCDNIMCDRLSNKYGYICNACFEELCSLGVLQDIESFLDSEKEDCNNIEAAEAYFNVIFPETAGS